MKLLVQVMKEVEGFGDIYVELRWLQNVCIAARLLN